jgi:uncharacterized protein (DUF2236 family)
MARLPAPLHARLEDAARSYFDAPGLAFDFSKPAGAPALFAPTSIAWRVMKNPVALTIGGLTAVILELAEPRVRTGVWEHTTFRTDPVARMKRTGMAAMVTVYGPAEKARAMIAGVVRAHERIQGVTPEGAPYRANDEELLNWVNATAGYGFFEAYHRFVRPLTRPEMDAVYNEGHEAAALYGAHGAPRSAAEMQKLFAAMRQKLERSQIVFDFLNIVRTAAILPSRRLQRVMVRAAVDLTPTWVRDILGLHSGYGLRPGEATLLLGLGAASDRIALESAPPAQACTRLGLSADWLYRGGPASIQ